jgi:hypothetical protein
LGRKIGDAEERLKVLIDDFYLVREDIVLGPFPTHLGGTRLGRTRLGGTRLTGHPGYAKYDVNVCTNRSQEVSLAKHRHWLKQSRVYDDIISVVAGPARAVSKLPYMAC